MSEEQTEETERLLEECRYCDEPIDIEEDAHFKSVSDQFTHLPCMADHCYGHRELFATTEGTFRMEPVRIIEEVGNADSVIDSFWRAECPVCYQTHETDSMDESVRADLVDQVAACCDAVEWLPPEDYVEDCDICGDDHRESRGCTPIAARDPFPSADRHRFECTECDWSGDEGSDFGNREGLCPECDTTAVRAIEEVPADAV